MEESKVATAHKLYAIEDRVKSKIMELAWLSSGWFRTTVYAIAEHQKELWVYSRALSKSNIKEVLIFNPPTIKEIVSNCKSVNGCTLPKISLEKFRNRLYAYYRFKSWGGEITIGVSDLISSTEVIRDIAVQLSNGSNASIIGYTQSTDPVGASSKFYDILQNKEYEWEREYVDTWEAIYNVIYGVTGWSVPKFPGLVKSEVK